MKHSCPTRICPSLLSCDLARIADDAQQMLDMGADWLVRLIFVCIYFAMREVVPLPLRRFRRRGWSRTIEVESGTLRAGRFEREKD